ncbi:uncharacterized protein [Salminus brasiliensis]|uniref:uncharacterized protein n=1 Tax=Salminus brasiliensis TaxID=930266 RepID=UPI003B83406D
MARFGHVSAAAAAAVAAGTAAAQKCIVFGTGARREEEEGAGWRSTAAAAHTSRLLSLSGRQREGVRESETSATLSATLLGRALGPAHPTEPPSPTRTHTTLPPKSVYLATAPSRRELFFFRLKKALKYGTDPDKKRILFPVFCGWLLLIRTWVEQQNALIRSRSSDSEPGAARHARTRLLQLTAGAVYVCVPACCSRHQLVSAAYTEGNTVRQTHTHTCMYSCQEKDIERALS